MRDLVLGKDTIYKRRIYLPAKMRERHLYVLGRTGAGKSSFLHRLIHQDTKRPYATAVFDAGGLATSVLEALPDELMERVWFFSVEHPIPYNPFLRRRDEPARLENELFSLLDQVTVEASHTPPLTARMKRLLSTALREVLKEREPSFATLATYLVEKKTPLRQALQLREEEFSATWDGVIDRLSQFLRDPRIRRIICTTHELDFGRVIDEGRILLVSLEGLEPALRRFLGTLLFHGLQSTVLERRRDARRPVALYVDEFQDYLASGYAAGNFQTLFAQGRRYQVALAVAHQDFGTMPKELLQTIHGNAACLVSFSCGAQESRAMSALFGPDYVPEMVGFLADYHAVTRVGENVYPIKTYPPLHKMRELDEDAHVEHTDPPDPLAVIVTQHADQDAYTNARKPRRAAAGTRKG